MSAVPSAPPAVVELLACRTEVAVAFRLICKTLGAVERAVLSVDAVAGSHVGSDAPIRQPLQELPVSIGCIGGYRFEAAHYECVCKSAGIPIHYCAEQFSNEGRIEDSLLETLKRLMAGEFSRDPSARVSGGLNNIVARGFKYGSVPGDGLRRILVGPDGRCRQLLAPGELKNISSDRVVFVPGPPEERAIVREIYRRFVEERLSMRQIVRELNERRVPWTLGFEMDTGSGEAHSQSPEIHWDSSIQQN